jgi:hypothetical protein
MRRPERAAAARGALALAAALLAACGGAPTRAGDEAARNTFVCQLGGERLVLRFEPGEARLLLPGGDRVALYEIPAASGVRYSNGSLELRGKGTEFLLVRDGILTPLLDCQPYSAPR